jgi:hypothetical protein
MADIADIQGSATDTRKKATKVSGDVPASAGQTTRNAHFILQGKGGVGKSLVANLLTQYLTDQNRLDCCFDTDPVNGSLQNVPALHARPVELLNDDTLNVRGVDKLVEAIVSAKRDVVVDNGAASFLPFSRYLSDNDIPAMLADHSTATVMHTIVTGGGNAVDTLKGLTALVQHFTPGASIVVWVNEFFGPARFDGLDFEKTALYENRRADIHGVVYLRKLDPVMFAPNFADMLERQMTFAEAAKSDDFMLMEKSRLFRIKTSIWEQLDRML